MQRIKMACPDSDWSDGYSKFQSCKRRQEVVWGLARKALQDMAQIVTRSQEWRNYAARVGGRAAGLDAEVCHFLSSGEGEKQLRPSLKVGKCQ